jgi:hypothetical protein
MNTTRSCLTFFIVSLAFVLGGCATASKPTAMVAPVPADPTPQPESFSVVVTGGSETSSMGASKISNADFAEAIKTSVLQASVFASHAPTDQAAYNLNVQIVRLDQPMFGASFTVDLETTWRLTNRSTQTVVWEKAILSSFTATMGDSLSGVTRLRLANEGAARANIQDALTQLSSVNLP